MLSNFTKTQLAKRMNISLSTLKRWLKKNDMDIDRKRISKEEAIAIFHGLGFPELAHELNKEGR